MNRIHFPTFLVLLGTACEGGALNDVSLEASMQGADAVLLDLDDLGEGRDEDGFRAYHADVASTDVPQIDGMRATFAVCERSACAYGGLEVPEGAVDLLITLTTSSDFWRCQLLPEGPDWAGRCTAGSVVYDPVFIGPDLDVVEAW